jgi:hypothetical protein
MTVYNNHKQAQYCLVKWRIASLLLTVAVFPPPLMVRAAQTGPPSYDRELARLKLDFVRILRRKRTAEFLSYVSPQGVVIGVDEDDHWTPKALAEAFRRKRVPYCVLFDSSCLSGDHKAVCSARGLLLTSAAEVTISAQTSEGETQAYLSVSSKDQSCLNGTQSFEFIFRRLNGTWKLIAVPYS